MKESALGADSLKKKKQKEVLMQTDKLIFDYHKNIEMQQDQISVLN